MNATATDLFSYCDVHIFEWKNVGQDLLLWAGCWLDVKMWVCYMKVDEDEFKRFKCNKWLEKSCIRHLGEVCQCHQKVQLTFWWKIAGSKHFKHAAYAQMYCSQCMQLENTWGEFPFILLQRKTAVSMQSSVIWTSPVSSCCCGYRQKACEHELMDCDLIKEKRKLN